MRPKAPTRSSSPRRVVSGDVISGIRPAAPSTRGRRRWLGYGKQELRAAASALGVREVVLLDYQDQELDRVPVREVVSTLAGHIRRLRPDVVLTFAPDGAYGHPDHIAISQLTMAAVVASADSRYDAPHPRDLGSPHTVSKLYFLAWSEAAWAAYQAAFKKLVATVDGVERQATPWPDWSITTVIDTRPWSAIVRQAVGCHVSQTGSFSALARLTPADSEALFGSYSFYRAFSLVNGGRIRESDLFDGVEPRARP